MIHPLGRKKLFFSLYKFFLFQIYFRLMKGEYLFKWIDNCKFLVSPGETGLTGNLYLGLHEFEDMGFLLHYLNEDDFFIDIGSNVGSYTLLSGIVKKCKTVSFEPIPATFKKLKTNVMLNTENDNITLYNKGLSDKKGELFFTNNLNTTNKVVIEKVDDCITVEVNTLDSYNFEPSVIKIDVEGYEQFVINGGEGALNDKNTKVLIVELNDSGSNYGSSEENIYNQICSYGFKSYIYDPFKKSFTETNAITKTANNTLFLKGDINEFVDRVEKSKEYLVNGLVI